jgi:AAT family amino acid transporter
MMALGSVIGGSFFLGTAIAIRAAGTSVIISYIIGGILVYFILFALSEMTVANAAPGSFRHFAQSAFGPGVGFVTGWTYWAGMVLAMSSEATAASIFIHGWLPGVPLYLLGLIIIAVVTLANLLGAKWLSKLESLLAGVKVFTIAAFIILALALITGFLTGRVPVGLGKLVGESVMPAGIKGMAGSMLMVMFTYAGFEVIGLAAAEASEPLETVPKAIGYTVASLAALYIGAIAVLLPLVSYKDVKINKSPFVSALEAQNISWAAGIMNIILFSAIFSTMLAAMFGLGRMIRSLAGDGHAPHWILGRGNVPYRGIIASGVAMATGLVLAYLLPSQVYMFLVSSGGFTLLFTYVVITATHYKLRKKLGCPPKGKCQLPGFPYTSIATLIALILVIASMPFIPGQSAGLVAGLILVALFILAYIIKKRWVHS